MEAAHFHNSRVAPSARAILRERRQGGEDQLVCSMPGVNPTGRELQPSKAAAASWPAVDGRPAGRSLTSIPSTIWSAEAPPVRTARNEHAAVRERWQQVEPVRLVQVTGRGAGDAVVAV